MRFGFSRWHWYDFPFLGLAFLLVYPDQALDWFGQKTGRLFGLRHVILLMVTSALAQLLCVALLRDAYPRVDWYYPLIFIGALAAIRAIAALVNAIFNLND